MSRKNVLPYKLATAQSLSSSFNSAVTTITYTDNISYQINCTTTNSVGTFALEVSDDYQISNGTIVNAGTWNPLTLGGGIPAVNATDAVISISLTQVPFGAIRVAFTSSTPGTGTCDIYFLSKQLGG